MNQIVDRLNAKMKFPEPKTVYEATLPTLLAKWFFGVGIIQYPFGHHRPTISLCWSIVHIILLLALIHWGIIVMNDSTLVAPQKNYAVITFLGGILKIVIIISSRIKSKNTIYCYRQLTALNKKLNRLGISEDYGLTFKLQFLSIIGSLLLTSLFLLTDYIFYSSVNKWYWILLYYQTFFNTTMDSIFCCNMRYLLNRFENLNKYLVQSAPKEINSDLFLEDFEQPFTAAKNIKLVGAGDEQCMLHILQETRNLHGNLCKLAMELNREFDIYILFTIIACFGYIIATLYVVYMHILRNNTYKLVRALVWLMLYVSSIVINIYTCSTVAAEGDRTGHLIFQLLTPTSSQAVRDEIHTFALQQLRNPLEFTAGQFFPLNNNLLCSMVGSVTTYLIIIIQMQSFPSQ